MPRTLAAAAVALALFSGSARAQPPDAGDAAGALDVLHGAIAFFDSGDRGSAAKQLADLLARDPPHGVAGAAHLYLGLIALADGHGTDEALVEFQSALLADPAVSLPHRAPPRARTLFARARKEAAKMRRQGAPMAEADAPEPAAVPLVAPLAAPEPPVEPPPPVLAPAPEPPRAADALTVPLTVDATPAPSHPSAAAIVLASAAAAAGAVAVYGGIQVLNYNNLVGRANGAFGTVSSAQVAAARGQAQVWAVLWIPLALAGAASGTGAALTW